MSRLIPFFLIALFMIGCESNEDPSNTPTPQPILDEGSGPDEEPEEPTLKFPRVEGDLCFIKDEASWSKEHADKIQVVVRTEGKGNVVKKGDILTCHYRGLLFVDGKRGKQFDSSFDRKETVDFPIGLGNVIPGWDKSLVGRRIGDEVTIILPYKDGYGEGGNPRAGIPGKSMLVFDVQIVNSKPPYITIASEANWQKDKAKELQVAIIKKGKGAIVKSASNLTCHYRGQLWLNGKRGKQFDSSYDRGKPATFPIGIGRVIVGWDRTLVGLPLGTKLVVIIPSALGYGARGAGADIPPNSDLVFDVELLDAKSLR